MGGKILEKQNSLKMYISMKSQFILRENNIVRVTSNQLPIPYFKNHKTWSLPTNHVNHRLLLHVALGFSTFAWLWMFLTQFALIFRSLFGYCGARGKFLTFKNIVCLHTNRQYTRAGTHASQSSPSDLWDLWELPWANLKIPWAKLNLLWANLTFS